MPENNLYIEMDI